MNKLGWWMLAIGLSGCGGATASGGGAASNASGGFDGGGDPALAGTLSGQVLLLGAASGQGVQVAVAPWGLSAVSDANGSFLLEPLPAGDYSATFSAPGYQSQTVSGTELAGAPITLSITLERSQALLLLALPDGGAWLGGARWVSPADAGRQPGAPVFYGDGQSIALVDPTKGVIPLYVDGGSYKMLGFDSTGDAVLKTGPSGGPMGVEYVGAAGVWSLPIGIYAADSQLVGDTLYYANLISAPTLFLMDWVAVVPGNIAPIAVGSNISPIGPPAGIQSGVVGWDTTGPCAIPMLIGLNQSQPFDVGCSVGPSPITTSLDGTLAAEIFQPAGGGWNQVLIIGNTARLLTDGFVGPLFSRTVYPLDVASYVGITAGNPEHLYIAQDGGLTWESDVVGWAPLHGAQILVAAEVDGGTALTTEPASGPGIPFLHTWAPPVFSDSNRYVVFPGVASLFDLKAGVEAPLTLNPVQVVFDHAEQRAVIVDGSGAMAMVVLDALSATAPAGVPLEGTAVATALSADDQQVLYAGTDAAGRSGIFAQPWPQ